MAFNRKNLLLELRERAESLQTVYGFITSEGAAQLKGRPRDEWEAYGHWVELLHLIDEIRNQQFGCGQE